MKLNAAWSGLSRAGKLGWGLAGIFSTIVSLWTLNLNVEVADIDVAIIRAPNVKGDPALLELIQQARINGEEAGATLRRIHENSGLHEQYWAYFFSVGNDTDTAAPDTQIFIKGLRNGATVFQDHVSANLDIAPQTSGAFHWTISAREFRLPAEEFYICSAHRGRFLFHQVEKVTRYQISAGVVLPEFPATVSWGGERERKTRRYVLGKPCADWQL